MKSSMFFLLALVAVSPVSTSEVSPVEQVIQMLSELEAKVIGEGRDAEAARTGGIIEIERHFTEDELEVEADLEGQRAQS